MRAKSTRAFRELSDCTLGQWPPWRAATAIAGITDSFDVTEDSQGVERTQRD